MIQQARENLGVAAAVQTTTVADTGYGAGADLQAAVDKQMTVLAPPAEGKPTRGKPYAAQNFYYDPAAHTVILSARRELGPRRPHDPQRRAYRTLPLPLPGLPSAWRVHARSQRPADRSVAAHRDCASDASAPAPGIILRTMEPTVRNHRTAFWADQTTRRLPALDGVGLGERAHAMVALLCATLNLQGALPTLAKRARRWSRERAGRQAVSVGQFVLAVAGWLEIMRLRARADAAVFELFAAPGCRLFI